MIRRLTHPLAATSALLLFACVTDPSLGQGDTHKGSTGQTKGAPSAPDAGVAPRQLLDAGPAPDSAPPPPPSADCAALLASMLASPISPPAGYASLDLGSGANPKGLTIDEANAAGCATMSTDLPPVEMGGYRSAHWGATTDINVSFNVESRIIYQVVLGKTYTGTVKFQSRPSGTFGVHSYEIGIGRVLRDGVDMPIDWTTKPFPWASELFDGLLATFSPSTARAPVDGCKADGECLVLADDGSGNAYFGMRDLAFYVMFPKGTNKPSSMYSFWKGGKADCSTPTATLEAMDYGFIFPGFTAGTLVQGVMMGGLDLSVPKPTGLTWQSADAIECHGRQVPAPDPGYAAMEWGPSGELLLEFNQTSNLAYKIFAKAGYKGTLDVSTYQADGVTVADSYSVGIGTLTKDGKPFAIDWASPTASVTELSNAINYAADTDCVAAGNCTITPDDKAGHSVVDFPLASITVRFGKGTSAPESIYGTWAGGK